MIHIKSERELDHIRESCRLVVESFRMVENLIAEGITTQELDRAVEVFIKKNGGKPAFKGYRVDKAVFPASSCISVEDEVVHGIPGRRKLKKGEIVSIDIGVEYQGYFGDGAKTYPVGPIDDGRANLMRVTLESLYHGIAKAVKGNRLQDISNAIQIHAESNGYSIVRELVGHGTGRKLHEEPQIPNYGKPNTGPRLRSGMVLAIEPMVNFGSEAVRTQHDGWTVVAKDGMPSAHFEHTVVVRDGEAEILTKGLC